MQEDRRPFIITQNGEAKAVIQDYESFEQMQETLALLKILALGNRQIKEKKFIPADQRKKIHPGRASDSGNPTPEQLKELHERLQVRK